MDGLRASARSRTAAVTVTIPAVVREDGRAEVQAIGAEAVSQLVKAVASAKAYLAQNDQDDIGGEDD